jgi:hypothetical protein
LEEFGHLFPLRGIKDFLIHNKYLALFSDVSIEDVNSGLQQIKLIGLVFAFAKSSTDLQ